MSRVSTLVWDLTIKVPVPQRGDPRYIPGTGAAYGRADRWVREAVTLEAVDAWIRKGIRASNRDPADVTVLGFRYDPSSMHYLGVDGPNARMRFTLEAEVDGGNPVPFVVILVALAIIAGTVVLDVVIEDVTGKGVFDRIGSGIGKAVDPAARALGWVVFGIVLLVLALGGALSAGPVKVSRLAKGRR